MLYRRIIVSLCDTVILNVNEKTINSGLYLRMLRGGESRLGANKDTINDLNVFPIPDGDTGDNMLMTLSGGIDATRSLTPEKTENQPSISLGETASKASKGMLLGARGNSGVILSRFFAGIAKGLEGLEEASTTQFADALAEGVKSAYGAVSTPVEGTMLTVLREGVEAARSEAQTKAEAQAEAKEQATAQTLLETLIEAMKVSLEHTPELLPVLKEAGVVDSGGAGVLCIAEGMLDALEGKDIPAQQTQNAAPKAPQVDLDGFGPDSVVTFGYCTEFLLRLQTSKVGDPDAFDPSPIKEFLESAGESVVCFKDGSIVKAHVHTPTPGQILNKVQQWGEFLTVKIENMNLQHSGVTIQNNFDTAAGGTATEPEAAKTEAKPEAKPAEEIFAKKRKRYAVVAVACGEGLVQAFKDAGVDEVIEGGQTMNPSAADFVAAFERADAETIFVFPNNSNIILAANQAASLYKGCEIVVLPSKDLGSGYVAAASIDRSCPDKQQIVDAAIETIGSVETCMVSKATRDAQMDGVEVHEGDYLGFERGRIICAEKTREVAALKVAETLGIGLHDVAIVFSGADTPEAEAAAFAETLQNKFPRTETMLTPGGQPVYDYIIILC